MRIIIILIWFIAGFYIVRYLINTFSRQKSQKDDSFHNSSRNHGYGQKQNWNQHSPTETSVDMDTKYRNILGVAKNDGIGDIKNKYRELISKYHPDKVQHLGREFQEMAELKTKEILEAYQYFTNKYGI